MEMNDVIELLETKFNLELKSNKLIPSGIISYNGGSLYIAIYSKEICCWTVVNNSDGRGVGDLPLASTLSQVEATLKEWLTNVGKGLYRCGECGKWIPKEETRVSGFVGVVCQDCPAEIFDTTGD